jgi:hypothetical protein
VLDLPQGADLAAHGLIPGGVVEELDRALLVLDVVAYAVDLREAASPDDLEDLETAVDDITDRVVVWLGPGRGPHLLRVRLRQRLAAPQSQARSQARSRHRGQQGGRRRRQPRRA